MALKLSIELLYMHVSAALQHSPLPDLHQDANPSHLNLFHSHYVQHLYGFAT